MPGYKGHLAGGLFAYFVLMSVSLLYFRPTLFTAIEWSFFALAGSLFPDVDTKSKGQKYFYRLIAVLLIFLAVRAQWRELATVSLIATLPLLVSHRGLFHRLWFIILFPAAIAFGISLYFPNCEHMIKYDYLFFVAGAISHLWLDLGLKRMLRIYQFSKKVIVLTVKQKRLLLKISKNYCSVSIAAWFLASFARSRAV